MRLQSPKEQISPILFCWLGENPRGPVGPRQSSQKAQPSSPIQEPSPRVAGRPAWRLPVDTHFSNISCSCRFGFQDQGLRTELPSQPLLSFLSVCFVFEK